jgi:hypothetical protein
MGFDQLANAALGLAALAALGAAQSARAAGDPKLRAELEALGQRRVFFGHQSVGVNLIEGLELLAAQEGVSLRIAEAARPLALQPGTLSHAFLAQNGDPVGKLRGFAEALGSARAPGAEVAVFKLCWADFTPDTDAGALFAKYQATVAELEARHPQTTFVHVTTPLTAVQSGLRALLKKALGRTPYGLAENARREEYNALLRRAYQGREPFFDLAAVESVLPDGRREAVDWNGRAIPVLAAGYTDDGGHLNRSGRLRAARELLAVLSAAPAARR